MNRRTAPLGKRIVGSCVVAAAVAVVAVTAPVAPGQAVGQALGQALGQAASGSASATANAGPTTLPVSSLPTELKTNFNPTDNQGLVDAYIDTSIKNLTSANPGAQSRGREDLIAGAMSITPPAPTFVAGYLGKLSKSLDGIIGDTKQSLRTRIEAGIVVARIAMKSSAPTIGLDYAKGIEGVTLKLLSDPSEIVVLWGMKSASNLVPALVQGNVQTALTKTAIADAVARHVNFGPVAAEAYQGLTLNYPILTAPVTVAPSVVPELQEVFAERLKSYRGPGLPNEPFTEQKPSTFLTLERVWNLETHDQQTRTVQLIADMIQLCAQQYAYAHARPDQEALAATIQNGAKSLEVALGPKAGAAAPAWWAPLDAALVQLARFNINVNTPQDATNAASAMFAALKGAMQGLQPVATVAPPPTTNPTGGTGTAGGAGSSAADGTAGNATPAAMTTPAGAR